MTMKLKPSVCAAVSWKNRQERIFQWREIHVFRSKAGEQGKFKELKAAQWSECTVKGDKRKEYRGTVWQTELCSRSHQEAESVSSAFEFWLTGNLL